eukprot:1159543-Pelagomonas_calceolata.AAC.5
MGGREACGSKLGSVISGRGCDGNGRDWEHRVSSLDALLVRVSGSGWIDEFFFNSLPRCGLKDGTCKGGSLARSPGSSSLDAMLVRASGSGWTEAFSFKSAPGCGLNDGSFKEGSFALSPGGAAWKGLLPVRLQVFQQHACGTFVYTHVELPKQKT